VGSGVTQVSAPQGVVGVVSFDRIAAGRAHTCAVHRFSMPASPVAAFCWGLNSDGQLGDGTTMSRSVPTPVADYRP
jgi:alpha-tubulin suppressor-like RCC1 family protein